MESNDTPQQTLDLEGRLNLLIKNLAETNKAVVQAIDKYLESDKNTERSIEELLREVKQVLCERNPPGCNP